MGEKEKTMWHLKPEISVGHLLSTIALVVAAFVWANGIDKRLSVVEARQDTQSQTDARQESRMERIQVDIKAQLEKLDGKIDRLIERELNNNVRVGRHAGG